jgi:hypothetical protein
VSERKCKFCRYDLLTSEAEVCMDCLDAVDKIEQLAAKNARIAELETIANLARRYVSAHAGARVRMQEAEYAREYEDAERALVLALDKEETRGR